MNGMEKQWVNCLSGPFRERPIYIIVEKFDRLAREVSQTEGDGERNHCPS
jgi:hypothetical protein